MPSLDDLLDLARDQARNVLVGAPAGEQLVPTWLVHAANDDVIIIQTPWADDRQKAITAQAMRETLRERKALAYSFLSEAWMSRRQLAPGETLQDVLDRRHAEGEMPRNDPERVEMVIATAGDTKGSKSRMWAIVRDKAGVVTDLVVQLNAPDMVVGRFEDCLVEARQ